MHSSVVFLYSDWIQHLFQFRQQYTNLCNGVFSFENPLLYEFAWSASESRDVILHMKAVHSIL